MNYTVIFYDFAEKWEEKITSCDPLSAKEAAVQVLEKRGRSTDILNSVLYRIGNDRIQPSGKLKDGDVLNIHRLLGGG